MNDQQCQSNDNHNRNTSTFIVDKFVFEWILHWGFFPNSNEICYLYTDFLPCVLLCSILMPAQPSHVAPKLWLLCLVNCIMFTCLHGNTNEIQPVPLLPDYSSGPDLNHWPPCLWHTNKNKSMWRKDTIKKRHDREASGNDINTPNVYVLHRTSNCINGEMAKNFHGRMNESCVLKHNIL